MASPYSLAEPADPHVLAWDTQSVAPNTAGAPSQPWRQFWPPTNLEALSEDEIKAKPWLTWKRDATRPNEKPWYDWVNIFEGEVDEPCQRGGCSNCGGSGCSICSTVAEGG